MCARRGVDRAPERREIARRDSASLPDGAQHDGPEARVGGEAHLVVRVRRELRRVLDRADDERRPAASSTARERYRERKEREAEPGGPVFSGTVPVTLARCGPGGSLPRNATVVLTRPAAVPVSERPSTRTV